MCGTLLLPHGLKPRQVPLSLGFPRQEYPEWVAISFSRGSFWPRDWTHISYIGRRILYLWASREARITWHHANISWCEICPSLIKMPQNHTIYSVLLSHLQSVDFFPTSLAGGSILWGDQTSNPHRCQADSTHKAVQYFHLTSTKYDY